MALLTSCQSLAKAYHARPLFDGLSFGIEEKDRLGIIGPNGAGKSTLLRLIAGLEEPDSGEIASRRGLRQAYISQVAQFPLEQTAGQIVEAAARAAGVDAHEADTRTAILLSQLGLTAEAKVGSLSGGWRKRLQVATGLVAEPDLLLLDEPTNHLDLDGVLWLEKLLKNAPFAWAMVSHDRTLLDRAATRIAEVSPIYAGGAFVTDGGYTQFLGKRATYLEQQQRLSETLANKVRREVEWLRRGPAARTTKAQSRIDEAHALIQELADTRSRLKSGETKIDFLATGRKTKRLMVVDGVAKTLGSRRILEDLNLVVTPGMGIGLLGANGSGKTTILRLLTKELAPDSGIVTHADGLKVVYFDQNRAQLDLTQKLKTYLADGSDSVVYRERSLHVASYARRFQFRAEQLELTLGDLSGGEQARALVAKLMLAPADVLLLDEPTNDLDIPTLEALEDSLADFPGAVVLVTHDRYFMDQVAGLVVGLEGDGRSALYADSSQWEKARPGRKDAAPQAAKDGRAKNTAEAPRAGKTPAKRLSYMEQREYDGMESAIAAAEKQRDEQRATASDAAIATSAAKLAAACAALEAAEATVEKLYARWAELEAKLSEG